MNQSTYSQYFSRLKTKKILAVAVIGLVIFAGYVLINTRAATPAVSAEVEAGSLTAPAVPCTDAAASGGRCVKFAAQQPPSTPVTPGTPGTSGTVTVLAASDTTGHCLSNDCDGAKPASDQAIATKPDGVILAGDLSIAGKLNDYTTYFDPTWGRLKSITRPAPGNHDAQDPGLKGFFSYFGASVNPPKGYYSYDIGAWHMIALNSNSAIAEQAAWIKTDMASHKTACTLAYWHEPLYSSSQRPGDPQFKPLWDSLYAGGAEVVVNGHNHNYERFAPQNPSGGRDDTRGIVQYTVGVGGDNFYKFSSAQPNSLVRRNDTHGFVKFVLSPTGWTSDLTSTTGASLDRASGTCR